MKNLFTNIFLKKLFRIALPIAAQEFIVMALNMVDVMMIGQKGEVAVASVALANQVSFIQIILMFGIGSSASVFTAQYWGKRDITNIRKILGINLLIAVFCSIIIFFLSHTYSQQIIGFYSTDPQVVQLGSQYLRISCLGFIPMAITSAFSASLRSTEYVRLPMVTSIIALTINTILNYCLIFGNFGFPALGVMGPSIATVTSRIIECLVIILFTYRKRIPFAGRIAQYFTFTKAEFVRYLKVGSPVILNELIWVLGITIYNMVYAHIGTESIAAYNISSSLDSLAFTLFIGLSHACAIIVGNQIGAENYQQAKQDAKSSITLAILIAIFVGGLEIILGNLALGIYQISHAAQGIAIKLLLVSGCGLWLRATNMTIYIGIIRSGGDTKFGLFTELGTIWLIGVPLALLGAFVFHFAAPIVAMLVLTEEAVKFIIGLHRFRSAKWINNLVSPDSITV
jgi:putative MATE family efflux protein